jgi:hypothetical protein
MQINKINNLTKKIYSHYKIIIIKTCYNYKLILLRCDSRQLIRQMVFSNLK